MGTTAPFGYRKDPQDKNHLIVDEATAPTVRLIYSLALEGYGTNRIGKVLYERKISKPSYYKQELFSQHDSGSDDYWYDWKQEVITRIIRDLVYKGGMYVHGTSKPTFKCKGRGYIRRADREVLENVHEEVVTKEVWQTVNDIIDRHTKVKPCTSGYENIFRGLLKCPDCGQTLLIHTDNRNPDRDLLDKTYYQFINNVLLSMNESNAVRSEKVKAEIDKLKKRNAELDQMYIRLYEDYSDGKLSEKKFTMMSAHYEQEQDANEEKLSELLALFKECADIQTADMLNLPVPEAVYENVVLKPSEYQKDIVSSLADRAEAVRNRQVDATVDDMLRITGDGRKLALDQRLLNPMLPDEENSKVNACVNRVYEIWERTKEKRLAQLIFCNLSTPKAAGKTEVSIDGKTEEAEIFDDVYHDIKRKLMAKGVPEEEVAFIHNADTETKKAELFGKVRSGRVRFLLGSTAKMGAGTNVQDRLIALHHLDVPWRPSDVGQILRTFKIKMNVEVTDNGKIII